LTEPHGVFIGRERELTALRTAFEHSDAGQGRLVLLVGEPGIGKTRTAAEFAAQARRDRPTGAWLMNFGTGGVDVLNKTFNFQVRAVRDG
jgi:MoxR-like ATPase